MRQGQVTVNHDQVLQTFTIYENPVDFPGKFVVRRFEIHGGFLRPDKSDIVCATLEEARAALPRGMYRLETTSGAEHPFIVETWV